jgi:hypothetical protein
LTVTGAVLAVGAAPALAVDPACTLQAGEGNNLTLTCQTNDRQVNDLHIGLQPGAEASDVSAQEAGVTCSSPPGFPGAIDCTATPPRPPGSTLTVNFVTQALYEPNDQDSFFGSDGASNFGPTDIGGPDRSQPPPGCHNWDWEVTVGPFNDQGTDPQGAIRFLIDDLSGVAYIATVTNVGPCTSPATVLHLVPNSGGRLLAAEATVSITPDTPTESATLDCFREAGDEPSTIPCELEALDPGESQDGEVWGTDVHRLRGNALAFVDCQVTPEQNRCANNTAEFEFVQFSKRRPGTDEAVPSEIADQPSRRMRRIRGTVQTADRAQKAAAAGRGRSRRKVQVALVRLPDAAGQKCRWLRSRRGKFRSKDPSLGRCIRPIWLTAKGTRPWVYRLRKSLPKGAYVLYARAFDSKGGPQVEFDERNRQEFSLT